MRIPYTRIVFAFCLTAALIRCAGSLGIHPDEQPPASDDRISPHDAPFTAPLKPGTRFNPSVSYFYGRFQAPAASLSMGLVVVGIDERIKIQFQRTGLISVFAVRPGTYIMNEFLCVSEDGKLGGGSLPGRRGFTVEAGKAYYLGDFQGHAIDPVLPKVNGKKIETACLWRADSTEYRYDETTEDLKRSFPELALETVDVKGIATQIIRNDFIYLRR